MDERSTHVKKTKKNESTVFLPNGASDRSLSILRMVARSYYVEKTLPLELNTTCKN